MSCVNILTCREWRRTLGNVKLKITARVIDYSNWTVLKSLGMFSLHRRVRFETIAEPSAASLSPRFHKCNADNDVIIPPRSLSSRSSSSSFLSLSARFIHVILLYSHFTLVALPRYYASGISTAALIFIEFEFLSRATTRSMHSTVKR